ncbi:hypothetical protein EJB05_07395, partial [Eragrostis curvula]
MGLYGLGLRSSETRRDQPKPTIERGERSGRTRGAAVSPAAGEVTREGVGIRTGRSRGSEAFVRRSAQHVAHKGGARRGFCRSTATDSAPFDRLPPRHQVKPFVNQGYIWLAQLHRPAERHRSRPMKPMDKKGQMKIAQDQMDNAPCLNCSNLLL